MIYDLYFTESAQKEWKKLPGPIKTQFKKKLKKLQVNPHVPANAVSGGENLYKIKLRSAGYRLIYEVIDEKLCIEVILTGRRDKIYKIFNKMFSS